MNARIDALTSSHSPLDDYPGRARDAETGQRPPTAGRLRDEATLMWVNCLVVLLLSWAAFAWLGVEQTAQTRRERANLAASTAKGFSEYVGLHLLITDRMLVNSREGFARSGSIPAHEVLTADFGQMAPMLLQVAIADAQGKLVASSLPMQPGLSIADRPHFLAFRDDPRDRLHVSQPVVGRVSKKMSLQLVRPILGAAGEFKGVIVASIDPLRLQQYFSSADAFSADGTVVITGRQDGIVRARFSAQEITWGQSILDSPVWPRLSGETSGSFDTVSVIDHKRRISGFHRVADYPLVVTVSARDLRWNPFDDLLALIFVAGFSLAMVAYTMGRVRRTREQEEVIEKLEESRRRAAQANRMKSNFLASISHELRTPLNSILGFSEIIRDVPDDPSIPRYAELIHGSGKHLLALLNNLLDLAKMEAGRMEVNRSEVDLGELLHETAAIHRGSAEPKGLRIDLDVGIPPGLRALMDTDRTKLVQVLNNVLNNAVKFTEAGAIGITATLAASAVTIDIRDTGRGIPADRLPHIFDRFQTVGSESEDQGGTGLGLALSRELVSLLGGSLTIRSVLGQGTTVTIQLPGVRLAEPQA